MNNRKLRTIHRWLFTFVGIFMVTWLLSGILMAIPNDWFGDVMWHKNPVPDYRNAVFSPAEAIATLEAGSSTRVQVKNTKLRQINEHLLYSMELADGSEQLVDASNGEPFTFTAELAESIIRDNFKIDAPLAEIGQVTEHSAAYPWGKLPVFRATFTDSSSVSYFIAPADLKVFRSSPVTRLRTAITSLHEFGPVNFLTSDSRVRKGLLIVIAGIALAGTIAGVLLTLPRRRG
jgi:hypothetical protein